MAQGPRKLATHSLGIWVSDSPLLPGRCTRTTSRLRYSVSYLYPRNHKIHTNMRANILQDGSKLIDTLMALRRLVNEISPDPRFALTHQAWEDCTHEQTRFRSRSTCIESGMPMGAWPGHRPPGLTNSLV